MVVDLIGIFELKGPYCTLNMTDWFLQALSVIPRGSWGDVARRFTMIRWVSSKMWFRSHKCCDPTASYRSDLIVDRDYDGATVMDLKPILNFLPFLSSPVAAVVARHGYRRNLFLPFRRGDSISETFVGFLVQTGEGIEILVMDRIRRCIDRSRAPISNSSAVPRERDPYPPLRQHCYHGFSAGRGADPAGNARKMDRVSQLFISLMPPRCRGRARGQIPVESEGQNEEVQRSVPLHRRARQVEDEVDELATRVDEMELVMVRRSRGTAATDAQRSTPPVGTYSSTGSSPASFKPSEPRL
ncbi:pentatricopeptide repeat-containing protein [Dorcoceras hygrometricum]|uniref:Pentatricopeptide repeat-containing protein n=1 Tax=Dorcoceras hygrometricum TaxID=472368 RepID=A0A2Z7CT00_9LAMI|nr:pentatricopeptide repeat-containing protein [Dorcoceras hygrometricum]